MTATRPAPLQIGESRSFPAGRTYTLVVTRTELAAYAVMAIDMRGHALDWATTTFTPDRIPADMTVRAAAWEYVRCLARDFGADLETPAGVTARMKEEAPMSTYRITTKADTRSKTRCDRTWEIEAANEEDAFFEARMRHLRVLGGAWSSYNAAVWIWSHEVVGQPTSEPAVETRVEVVNPAGVATYPRCTLAEARRRYRRGFTVREVRGYENTVGEFVIVNEIAA